MGQGSDDGLVEPEGVNAASEEVVEEPQQPALEHDQGRSGGDEPGQELSSGEG